MANDSYALRFTDEKYMTRNEVRNVMQIATIDQIWASVLNYRRSHAENIGLRNINKSPFSFTATDAILARLAIFKKKLKSFSERVASLEHAPSINGRIFQNAKLEILKSISILRRCDASELSLKAMLNGTYLENNEKHQVLLGYRDSLQRIEDHPNMPLSEDLLGDLYSAVLAQQELTSFYREQDPVNVYRQSQVNRLYGFAPHESIPGFMEELFAYLSNDAGDPFIKAIAAFYEVVLVKPFDSNNEEVGMLLCKHALAQSEFGPAVSLLPIEKMILPNNAHYAKLSEETQRENDLTYLVLYAIECLTPAIEAISNSIGKIEFEGVLEERAKPDPIDKAPPPPVEEAPVEVATPAPKAKVEEIEEKKEAPSPKEDAQPIQEAPIPERALIIPEKKMSAREISEYAQYIVQTNPAIKKGQARFYAAHCELGRYYTIRDYQRYSKCVYETARTSMDNLAAEHFYKKLRIKNKYVYTPIKQGGE